MRSRAEEEWGLKAVGKPSFKITRLLSSEKSMMCLPLQSVEEEPCIVVRIEVTANKNILSCRELGENILQVRFVKGMMWRGINCENCETKGAIYGADG